MVKLVRELFVIGGEHCPVHGPQFCLELTAISTQMVSHHKHYCSVYNGTSLLQTSEKWKPL